MDPIRNNKARFLLFYNYQPPADSDQEEGEIKEEGEMAKILLHGSLHATIYEAQGLSTAGGGGGGFLSKVDFVSHSPASISNLSYMQLD